MDNRHEIYIPKQAVVGWAYWYPEEKSFWQRPLARIVFSSTVFSALAAIFLSNFFQLRGFVNLLASRIDLGLLALSCIGWAWIVSRSLPKWKNAGGIITSFVIVIAAFALDRFAVNPKPYPTKAENSAATDQVHGTPLTKEDLRAMLENFKPVVIREHVDQKVIPTQQIDSSVRASIISLGDGYCGRVLSAYGDPTQYTPIMFLVWMRVASRLDYSAIIDSYSMELSTSKGGPWIPTQAIDLWTTVSTDAIFPGLTPDPLMLSFDSLRAGGSVLFSDKSYLTLTSNDLDCASSSRYLKMTRLDEKLKGGIGAHGLAAGWAAFNPPQANRVTLSRGPDLFYKVTLNTTAGSFVSVGDFRTIEGSKAVTNADDASIEVLFDKPNSIKNSLSYRGPR